MARTRMNAKGQIVLPKALRDAHGFKPGAEFEIIDGGTEVRLKVVEGEAGDAQRERDAAVDAFLSKRLSYSVPEITDAMMRTAILVEAKRKWDEENRQWDQHNSD